jgi:hypothetical protein
MVKRNAYAFHPIAHHEEIRVLKVFLGERDSDLKCMLATKGTSITALSINWKLTKLSCSLILVRF